ncbi:hypothetical protein [[Flexibacter] sp. ATCC 35208]|nr:hypothetical protein [[Flexibacter] sp. ATCC 35208]
MITDTQQYIMQVCIGVYSLQFTGLYKAVNNSCALSMFMRPGK